MLGTMERILQLKKIPFFSEFQVRELTAIASIVQEKTFAEGTQIIQEGEVGESLYLVLRGRVAVIKELGRPAELHIAEIGPDDYFGEMALFDRQPRSASVVAKVETHVLELSRFEFEEIMKEFPQIAIDACRVFSQRLRELQQRFGGSGAA